MELMSRLSRFVPICHESITLCHASKEPFLLSAYLCETSGKRDMSVTFPIYKKQIRKCARLRRRVKVCHCRPLAHIADGQKIATASPNMQSICSNGKVTLPLTLPVISRIRRGNEAWITT
jgi:hypothetical protein